MAIKTNTVYAKRNSAYLLVKTNIEGIETYLILEQKDITSWVTIHSFLSEYRAMAKLDQILKAA